MIGLAILVIAGVYLAVSFAVVAAAIKQARTKGRSPWKWGGAAALVMYLLVFWDWMPTVVVHRYACATESGFWVYKTLDQWKAEHPGIFETLIRDDTQVPSEHPNAHSRTLSSPLNHRFTWTVGRFGILPLNRFRDEQAVIDSTTGEVLARYVDFATGYGNVLEHGSTAGAQGLKLWLNTDSCGNGPGLRDDMRNLKNTFNGAPK